MRYFLELSFDGTAYHGWQIQKNAITVQEMLNKSISTLLSSDIDVLGAGRTDTGVHAIKMYCHFDTTDSIENKHDFIYHLNALLPRDIAAKELFEVKDDAHARFDAESRSYRYRLFIVKDPFEIKRSWFYPHPLNLEQMNEACLLLKTFEDFSCFSKSRTQVKTNLCKIKHAMWTHNGYELIFEITADRFLRNMVRAIVGTMVQIGRGEMDLIRFEQIILSGNRSEAGASVPAHGLYLVDVKYPDKLFKS